MLENPTHLLDHHRLDAKRSELADWLTSEGFPTFRHAQITQWIYAQRQLDFEGMSNLPKPLRARLAESFTLQSSSTVKEHAAKDGTEKLVVQFPDRGQIECVLLRDGIRRTICISSQVGCAMGCVFCASGLDGVDRNLTTGEILEQMLLLQRRLPDAERLSHIVVMGMGEPLANLDHLLPALDIAASNKGLGISPRRITISTVGLPQAMDELVRLKTQYHLAVSLHAPNDELRNQLVPVNRAIGIRAIVEAADRYFESSGRRLTFEYVLLGQLNDEPEHASQLVRLLRGRPALLNVIPYNPVAGLPYVTPSRSRLAAFRQVLEEGGLTVKFRQRKGDEINAACGQLRRSPRTEISSAKG